MINEKRLVNPKALTQINQALSGCEVAALPGTSYMSPQAASGEEVLEAGN